MYNTKSDRQQWHDLEEEKLESDCTLQYFEMSCEK